MLLLFRAVALEEFNEVLVSPIGCHTQRRRADVVLRIDAGTFSNQQLGDGLATIVGGEVQRRHVMNVSCIDIRTLLLAGADKVSINTAAIARPEFVAEAARKFGSQCIVVAIDAKGVSPGKWEIFTHGGRRRTGIDAVDWAQRVTASGAGEILLTSMDRDGTGEGFDLALTRAVADAVTVPVIASGGVGTLDHLVEGIIEGHATAVLAASIFHFGIHSIRQAKAHMKAAGIPVRLE